MITGLSHACFVVSDLEKSAEFYRDRLGLAAAFDLNIPEAGLRGVYLRVGGRTFIELFQGDSVPTPDEASYKHICLEVDDIEETVQTLRERGVEVGDISLGKDRSYQAWLTDPDGNRIELHQFTAESLQIEALERLGG
ncbi:MAG: VOC family protein [Candidatus Brocadiae bacterium]|nr:VOC family protein [Candidatus Brocadiia bacterium]